MSRMVQRELCSVLQIINSTLNQGCQDSGNSPLVHYPKEAPRYTHRKERRSQLIQNIWFLVGSRGFNGSTQWLHWPSKGSWWQMARVDWPLCESGSKRNPFLETWLKHKRWDAASSGQVCFWRGCEPKVPFVFGDLCSILSSVVREQEQELVEHLPCDRGQARRLLHVASVNPPK